MRRFGPPTIIESADAAAAGDLDGDRDVDLVVTERLGLRGTSVLLNQGDGSFVRTTTYDLLIGDSLALSDVDRDGDLDLALVEHGNDVIAVSISEDSCSVGVASFPAVPGSRKSGVANTFRYRKRKTPFSTARWGSV